MAEQLVCAGGGLLSTLIERAVFISEVVLWGKQLFRIGQQLHTLRKKVVRLRK